MAVQFQAFASAPTAPSNLTAVVSSAGVIRLDWAASTDDVRVAGYLVERCVGADCTGFVQVASLPASGISGPLKVSTNNPRYFASPSGQTVLLGGSHHWANFSDMGTVYPPPAFDYDAWLDFLSTNRHNFFRLWVEQLPKHNYTIQDAGPWYSTPQPWLRTGPGNASDGLPKFDLTKFNPAYFDRLRERVLKANARGIYVAITLFDGYHLQFDRRPDDGFPLTGSNNINGVDDGGGVNSHILASIPAGVLAAEEDYVRKVIDTVNDLPNVCYEIANEAGGYSTAWQQHMIALIKNYETNKPLQHPVGFTFQYDGGTDASLYASAADWVSPKERFPSNNGTRRVLNNDTDHSYFWTEMKGDGPELNCAFVWRNFCAGNSAMFMDPYLMPWTKSGIVRNAPTGCGPGPSCTNVDPAWNSIRFNIGYMLERANSQLALARMTPQPALTSTANCLAQASATNAEYLVFAPAGGTFTVNLSATTNLLNVQWLKPATGAVTNVPAINGGSSAHSFTTPFSGDAVLYLVDAARPPVLTNVTYMDAGLSLTSSYRYRIRAVDSDGNLGAYSEVVSLGAGGAFPVKHGPDHRHLVAQDGTPFPILGRTAWFITSLTPSNYMAFIDDTVARGFNTIEFHVINHDPRGNNPPFAGNGAAPFLNRLDGAPWSGTLNYTNIGNEAPDFTTPDETYWNHVDSVLSYCQSKGVLVLMFPAYVGYGGGEQGWMQEMVANGASRMQAYGAWIAARYRYQNNLVWMLGGDYGTPPNAFTGPETTVEGALITGLTSIANAQSALFSAEWESESIATDQSEFGSAISLNGCYSWTGGVARLGRRAYTNTPVMPAFFLEGPFDEEGPDALDINPAATQPVRRFQWWGWLSSIGGHVAGNGHVWPFRSDNATNDWRNHLATQGAQDMGRLNAFIRSIAWHKLVPSGLAGMQTLITSNGASPASSNYVAAAATTDGSLLVAYVPPAHTGSIAVDMTALGDVSLARWFDPTSGSYTDIAGGLPNSGSFTFTPPATNSAGDGDWVLVIQSGTASGPVPVIELGAMPQTFTELALHGFQLQLSANLSGSYVIEASTNLVDWEILTVAEYSTGLLPVADPGPPPPPVAFYRAVALDGAPAISLTVEPQSCAQIGSNGFCFTVTSDAPAPLRIERSTDAVFWQPVGALEYTNAPLGFTDAPVRAFPCRFYRARPL